MIFAVAAPVLVLVSGGVIDVTNASMRQAQLQQSLDAAALAAIARNSPAYQAAITMTTDGVVTAPNEADQTQAIFNANHAVSNDTTVQPISVAVTKTGSVVSSTATVNGAFIPSFLGLVGISSIRLSATSSASDNIPSYINFYLLLDNSPSMALPAASADISRMISMTANVQNYPNCAFACHATADSNANLSTFATNPTDGGAPIVTRIQLLRQSVSQLFSLASTIEQENGISNEFQMAVYDFGPQAIIPQTLTNYVPLSHDLSAMNAAKANTIDVMTVPSENQAYNGLNNDEDTDLSGMLTQLFSAILPNGATVGNGLSAVTPKPVILLVSDGIDDSYNCSFNNGGTCREEQPIDQSTCAAIRAAGVTVAVLYTTYVALDNPAKTNPASWYDLYIYPFTTTNPTQIAQNMSACASPGLYSEVAPNQSIPTALTALFEKVVASVRITG